MYLFNDSDIHFLVMEMDKNHVQLLIYYRIQHFPNMQINSRNHKDFLPISLAPYGANVVGGFDTPD